MVGLWQKHQIYVCKQPHCGDWQGHDASHRTLLTSVKFWISLRTIIIKMNHDEGKCVFKVITLTIRALYLLTAITVSIRTPYLHTTLITLAGLGGSVGCAVLLETRRSWVQPPPRSATFFRGDWSWSIFYRHSLPSVVSRRAVVSFWRKNVHNTG